MKLTIGKISYYIIIITVCSIAFSPSIRFGQLGLSLDDIIIPIYGMLIFLSKNYYSKKQIKIFYYFASYVLFLIVSTLYGYIFLDINARVNDAFEIVRFVKYLFILIIVHNSNEKTFIEKFERGMSFSAIVLIILSFIEYFNIFNLKLFLYNIYNINIEKYYLVAEHRNVGSAGNPNDLSSILVVFSLFALHKFFNNCNKRSLYLIIFFLLVFSVFLTASRTGVIALTIGILYSTYITEKKSLLVKLMPFALIAIVVPHFFNSYISYFLNSISSFFDGESTSMNARYLIWESIIYHIKASPLMGYGTAKEFFVNNKILTDNEYLMILFKSGIIGFFIYFIGYFKSYSLLQKQVFPANKMYYKKFIKSIYLVSFIFMYTSSWFYSYKSFALFILLYAISIKYYSANNSHKT